MSQCYECGNSEIDVRWDGKDEHVRRTCKKGKEMYSDIPCDGYVEYEP